MIPVKRVLPLSAMQKMNCKLIFLDMKQNNKSLFGPHPFSSIRNNTVIEFVAQWPDHTYQLITDSLYNNNDIIINSNIYIFIYSPPRQETKLYRKAGKKIQF